MAIETVKGVAAPRPRPTRAAALLLAMVLSIPAAICAVLEFL